MRLPARDVPPTIAITLMSAGVPVVLVLSGDHWLIGTVGAVLVTLLCVLYAVAPRRRR